MKELILLTQSSTTILLLISPGSYHQQVPSSLTKVWNHYWIIKKTRQKHYSIKWLCWETVNIWEIRQGWCHRLQMVTLTIATPIAVHLIVWIRICHWVHLLSWARFLHLYHRHTLENGYFLFEEKREKWNKKSSNTKLAWTESLGLLQIGRKYSLIDSKRLVELIKTVLKDFIRWIIFKKLCFQNFKSNFLTTT